MTASPWQPGPDVPVLPGDDSATPFAGRHVELGRLAQWARAAAALLPQSVVIEGPARIGKTTLVHRATTALTGFTTVHLTCDPADRDDPYRLVDRAIEQFGRVDVPIEDVYTVGADVVGGRLLASVERYGGPVALVVDDLHWADEPSVQALAHMLRRLTNHRLLVVFTLLDPGTDTPEITDADLDDPARTRHRALTTIRRSSHELTLGGLDLAEFTELAALYGRHVAPSTLPDLHRHTAGHPEYSSMLFADRTLPLRRNDPPPVPQSFLRVVRDRLAEVEEDSRRLAEGIAVLGGRSPLPLAAWVSSVSRSTEALEPLLRAGLVRWWPDDPVRPVEASFPMLAGGIYRLCPPSRRRLLHETAAALVDGDAAWRHRTAAAGTLDVELADELEREVQVALAAGDAPRAVQYLDWAAQLSVTRADRQRLVLTAVLLDPGRIADRSLMHDVERLPAGTLRDVVLGIRHWHAGDTARARQLLERASAEVDHDSPSWLADSISAGLATMAVAQADGDRAIELARPVLAANRAGNLSATLHAARADAMGRLLTTGPEAALAAVEEFRRRPVPPDTALPRPRMRMVLERALCLVAAGRHVAALSDARTVLADPDMAEERTTAAVAAVHACYALGRWTEAGELVESSLDVGAAAGPWHRTLLAQSAVVAAGTGRIADAERRIADLATSTSEPGQRYLLAFGRAALGRVRGDATAVTAAFDDLRDSQLRRGLGLVMRGWWGPLRIEGLIETGRLIEAEALLRDLSGAFPPGPVAAWLAGLLAERSGRREEALRRYQEGVDSPAGPDDVVLHRAQLELALGSLLGTDPAGARWRGAAHDRFESMGAAPYARMSADGPGRTGVRLRRRGIPLTGREREVADLLLEGLGNRQIAARLYISEKTVEYHLRNVYAKHGVRTRHELRDSLGREADA